MRVAVVVLLLVAAPQRPHAEPWHKGHYGNNRILHLSISIGGTIVYGATGSLEDKLAADECRWCHPTGLDSAARDALRWDATATANTLSNLDAYVFTPVYCVGFVLAGTFDDPSTAAIIDDLVPILETTMIARYATRILKISVGRQRPDSHFSAATSEQYLSFPSGHTSGAVSLAVSAAVVARMRGYKSEPFIWIGGTAIALGAGYFRIAADRHYLTDVLGGAALGVAAGLTVPYLMKRNVSVMPTRDGIAVAGAW
jgi:membrane-associated phospholipid phosphatase